MSNTALDKAISFACSMIRKGQYMGTALSIAANYYKVDRSDVQKGVSSRSGKSQKGKKRPAQPKPKLMCEHCGEQEATWKATATWAYRNVSVWHTCDEHKGFMDYGLEGGSYDSVRWSKYKADPE